MKFKRFYDVTEFYNQVYDLLLRDEAQNMILLGNLNIGYQGLDKKDWRDPKNWFMATVSKDKQILLTVLMTPPHNITMYATGNKFSNDVLDCLTLHLDDVDIPGVTTESNLAYAFADRYTKRYGQTVQIQMNQHIYELKSVNPSVKQFGHLRPLSDKDIYFFPYWLEAFHAASHYGQSLMTIPEDIDLYNYRIKSQKLYILEVEGSPVSMVGFTREMKDSIGIAFVYTPPYFRKRGYATSAVAKLSQVALDQGYQSCVLYTDLDNPTSNHIYQEIGYESICDSSMLEFIKKDSLWQK